MISNLRFELSFKDIFQLKNKLNFCAKNQINKINIPCKGEIKKNLYNETVEYISKNYKEMDVVYHYSLRHQFYKNRDNSYFELLNFIKKFDSSNKTKILLVSGSQKKKNFNVPNVLHELKN